MYICVMTDMNTEKYLRYKDVAKLMQLSVTTIKRYVQDRKIPYYKLGATVRFSLVEINEWMKSRKKNKGVENREPEQGGLLSQEEEKSGGADGAADATHETGGGTR
jgi:excisionase family DNA binding protein